MHAVCLYMRIHFWITAEQSLMDCSSGYGNTTDVMGERVIGRCDGGESERTLYTP